MKFLALVPVSIFLLVSCQRNNELSPSGNNEQKLQTISSDSSGVLEFSYNGDTIDRISGNEFANVQYLNSANTQCVSLSLGNGYGIKYYLNSFKLPAKIIFTDSTSGAVVNSDYAVFFFHKTTNLLDSAIVNENGYQLIYKPTYSGNDISGMEERYVSATQNMIIANYSYTYSNENNIFVKTDSLLYIYTYPVAALNNQAMVTASFFAETFSASTFNSIHISGITSDYVFKDHQTSIMTPSVNSNGKIVAETFSDSFFEELAGKKYTYQ